MSAAVRPVDAISEFRVGLRSAPYMADHAVQDMVVLPGSFFIERALSEGAHARRGGYSIHGVTFRNPIILGADDAAIRVRLRDTDTQRVEYTFHEVGAGDDDPTNSVARAHAARLEIGWDTPPSPGSSPDGSFIEAFKARADAVIPAAEFYDTLRANANQYGPSFQMVAAIWRDGEECLGRLTSNHIDRSSATGRVHPGLLDSITQLLAPFIMDEGRTIMLRSVDHIAVTSTDFPETLWGHAVVRRERMETGRSLAGDIRVFDEFGRTYLDFRGVTFSFIERPSETEAPAPITIAVTSNFTAEPVEDALRFWGDQFGVPVDVAFAPYNQVFQQLLDPRSVLRRNRDGANVVLLSIEEWARRRGSIAIDRARADRSFGARPRTTLPNGLEIVHLHHYETNHLYREIFEDQCYFRHGIHVEDGSTVVDIGANIGMFSLFVMSRCRNPTIYAYEPAPAVFELLKANCEAYGAHVHTVNAGVAGAPGIAPFTFYENSSVFSGFHAGDADRVAIEAVVRNAVTSALRSDAESADDYVTELSSERLASTTHDCRLTTVSEIIAQHGIERIDLLKIDAEKSEIGILDGIADGDWPKIRQIVLEIHDAAGSAAARIEALLVTKGFQCAREHVRSLERTGFVQLYATRDNARQERPSGEAFGADPVWITGEALTAALDRNVRDFIAALRSFVPDTATPVVLCISPRTPPATADAEVSTALNAAEHTLLTEASAIANVHTVDSATPLRRYSVCDYHNPHTHRVGHIPYTPECYAALGSAVFRAMVAVKRAPFKVIVLDCDNTLWSGVCGEDGPLGVDVSAPFRHLQQFMRAQVDAGMLLCLCSKNNEQDVLDVFEQRTDMVLRRDHFVARRVNWRSKSDNLKSLAQELNLGLDSFIFVDDNPLECADVRAHCPGVLALQVPTDSSTIPAFFEHAWAFDHADVTEADRTRTRLYQENANRQRFREQAMSLAGFVQGLQLRIEIAEATDDQVPRVAQLGLRTNQFNFTTARRTQSDVRTYIARPSATCLVVRVADRFGDYGLVGVVMYESAADRFKVDAFMMSCRVFGRGVEHAMLARVAQRAVREGKRLLEIAYRPTEKNGPVAEFLSTLGPRDTNDGGTALIFVADRLAGLEYDPQAMSDAPDGAGAPAEGDSAESAPESAFATAAIAAPLQRISSQLHTTERLLRAIEEYRLLGEPAADSAEPAPADAMQFVLAGIWRRVLGRPRIGVHENFLDAGGTSLKAVQVIAAIKKELKQSVTIVNLFEFPTVALLAAKLSGAAAEPHDGVAPAAMARGLRRQHVMRRRVQ